MFGWLFSFLQYCPHPLSLASAVNVSCVLKQTMLTKMQVILNMAIQKDLH